MSTRYCFLTHWLDPTSGVQWVYQFFYYPETKEVELFDVKNRRHVLKRIRPQEDVKPELLYIGGRITIYARQLQIVEYGDEFTRGKWEQKSERTLAMVKPDALRHLGKILHAIYETGFVVSNMRMCKLSKREAEAFYACHQGKPFFENLTNFMSSGRVVAMELMAPGAIGKWRNLIGPTNSETARQEAPNSLRAHFGTDNTMNACHGSDAPDTAAQEIRFFFGPDTSGLGKCDVGQGTTLCVVKPHIVMDGAAGLVLDRVQDHYVISAAKLCNLDKVSAAEFLEVYKGVLAAGEFNAMVDELVSGPCIALEIADPDGANPVEAFRELCGPMDPELGRVLRPKSIRAQFGLNKTRNGVHCTDLVEDGQLEVEYFFSILP